MIQLFLKNKIAVGLTAVVLAGTVGMTVGGMTLSQKMKTRFPADGYVLDVTVDGRKPCIQRSGWCRDSHP